MRARVDGMNQTMVCLIAARPGQPGGKSQTEDTQEMTVVTQPALSDRTGSGESEGALDRPDDIHVYLPEIWAVHARHFPRKDAIVCGADRLSWRDFDQAMNRLANALHARGLGRDDKVAVLLGNEVMTIPVMFGVVKARACLVPLSAMLTPDHLPIYRVDEHDPVDLEELKALESRKGFEAAKFKAADVDGDGKLSSQELP